MAPLPKHLRTRYRYLACHLEADPLVTIDRSTFQDAVWRSIRGLFGDAGAARLGGTVIRFEWATGGGHAIVRTRRGETTDARAAIAALSAVDGEALGVRVAGISGTVRACEEKYIGRRPEASDQSNVVFDNADRSAVVRGDRVDVDTGSAWVGATTLDLQ